MLWLTFLFSLSVAVADDTSAPATPAAPAVESAPAATPAAPAASSGDEEEAAPAPKPKKVRRGVREKEAEGTQAPNRFEADTVIKSQYKLDGQPLEVDPD
jgi:hypothetical protein